MGDFDLDLMDVADVDTYFISIADTDLILVLVSL